LGFRLFKKRKNNEEEGKRRRKRGEEEEEEEGGDVLTSLSFDPGVAEQVRWLPPLIPLDSTKIDLGRIPSDKIDYVAAYADLIIDLQQILAQGAGDEAKASLLEAYKLLSQVRIYSAQEGWKLRMALGR